LANKIRFQRPHFYNLTIGLLPLNIAPQGSIPVISFLVQNDLQNTGVINVADGGVSLFNGVQLDPGRAWVFGVSMNSLVQGSLFNTPLQWEEAVRAYQDSMLSARDVRLYIDIHDFFAQADTPAQNLRIFWSTTTAE
jgi:hypothetical protein